MLACLLACSLDLRGEGCSNIYGIKAPSFLEPHFISANLAIHGLARVGCHLHKWLGIN